MGPADAQAVVISDDNKYGPIGIIFALLSYLIAIGVVVIMGAVAGLVWQERSSGPGEAGQLPLPEQRLHRSASLLAQELPSLGLKILLACGQMVT